MDSAGEQSELIPWVTGKNKHCILNMEKEEGKLREKPVLGMIMWDMVH